MRILISVLHCAETLKLICEGNCSTCLSKTSFKKISAVINKLVYSIEKVYQTRIIDSVKGVLENPLVDKICDKCGHNQMSYACRQTRSADEGQTVYYTCPVCNSNVVENA